MNKYVKPTLPDGWSWGHEPELHAGRYVYPGRAVVVIPGREWATTPEDCQRPWGSPGEWLGEGAVLVCPRCGIDCT